MGQQIVYCSKCQTRLLGHDLEQGKAVELEGRYFCRDCAPERPAPPPPKGPKKSSSTLTPTAARSDRRSTSGFTSTRRIPRSGSSPGMPASASTSTARFMLPPKKSAPTGLIVGAVVGGMVLLILIVAVATSGSSSPGDRPPAREAPAVAAPRKVVDREAKVDAPGADPARVARALEQIREIRENDGLYRRRDEVMSLYRATAGMAGARAGEIERMMEAYEKEMVERAGLVKGLEGWYRFRAAGKLGFDYSVNRDDTREIEGATWKADGPDGMGAVSFRGSGGMAIPSRVRESFTLACWVRTSAPGPGGDHWWAGAGLIDAEINGGNKNDFGLTLVGGRPAFGIGNPDTTILAGDPIADGRWHHVAATRDGRSGRMELYVDGVSRGSRTGPKAPRDDPAGLMIGRILSGANPYSGDLADVRIYSRDLSAAEIRMLAGK